MFHWLCLCVLYSFVSGHYTTTFLMHLSDAFLCVFEEGVVKHVSKLTYVCGSLTHTRDTNDKKVLWCQATVALDQSNQTLARSQLLTESSPCWWCFQEFNEMKTIDDGFFCVSPIPSLLTNCFSFLLCFHVSALSLSRMTAPRRS